MGEQVSCKVKDLIGASEAACRFCDDFTSTLADVSVGSVGSTSGYSTVIVRSPVGEHLVKDTELLKGTVDKQEIAKLAKFKKERAKKSFTELKTAIKTVIFGEYSVGRHPIAGVNVLYAKDFLTQKPPLLS